MKKLSSYFTDPDYLKKEEKGLEYTPQAGPSPTEAENASSNTSPGLPEYKDDVRMLAAPKEKPPRRISENQLAINQGTDDGKSYWTDYRNKEKGI